jgi:DNA-binding NtrC family response regulator
MAKPMVFVVDDEALVAKAVAMALSVAGYETRTYSKGADAVAVVKVKPPQAVLLDLMLEDTSGLDVLREMKAAAAEMPVIMMSGKGSISTAVEAVRLGAYDFLEKPIEPARLQATVRRALEQLELARQVSTLRGEIAGQYRMVGESAALAHVRDIVSRVAPTKASVLITGESGAGKELVARALHLGSTRAAGPFVALNCAAIPKELIESELFGHEKGAFTGAQACRKGKLEQADGGTCFLDEIGDMSLAAQSKLLRFLENSEVQRIGRNEATLVDVRVVAATNKNLPECARAGLFREDLYHRLNVVMIEVPALRLRPDDIEPLAQHFLGRFCSQHNRAVEFGPGCGEVLRSHAWPGNVRELRNVVERAVVLGRTNPLDADELRCFLSSAHAPVCGLTLDDAVARAEREAVEAAISMSRGNLTDAAKTLGVERASLYRIMKRLGMERGQEQG